MQGLTAAQQQDEEKDNLVRGEGPRQGSGPGRGAAASVEEVGHTNDGRVRWTTINPSPGDDRVGARIYRKMLDSRQILHEVGEGGAPVG